MAAIMWQGSQTAAMIGCQKVIISRQTDAIKKMTASSSAPVVPGTYILLLADVLERWSFSMETLLDGSGIDPEALLQADCQIPQPTFAALLRRAIKLTNEPGIGYHVGLQMKASYHGVFGQAAMVANNMREVIELTQAFTSLYFTIMTLHFEQQGDQAILRFEETHPQFELGNVGAQVMLLGFATMGQSLTGKPVSGIGMVKVPRPEYFSRFQHLVPGEVRFEQPYNGLIFPAEILDRPLVMADPIAARLAREQCKQELNRLAGNSSTYQLARDLAFDEQQGFASMEEVADKLHLSPRTLQRRLSDEGVSYREVVEHIRRDRALRLVASGGASIGQVADLLGYNDVTNFSRAFRRWTGESPRAYRQAREVPVDS